MSVEENKALIRRFTEAGNNLDFDALDEIMATDYKPHDPLPNQPTGREGFKQTTRALFKVFPDLKITIEDVIAEGDKVVARVTGIGTHQGEFMGIAPTGKKVTVSYIRIFRIANGKITEDWTGIRRSTPSMIAQLRG